MDNNFWKGKKVFLTGHTGFKGSWLSLWLSYLGADVCGYSLIPPTNPSLFELCRIESDIKTIVGDIRDYDRLSKTIYDFKPEIVIHMAAQAIVRESYVNPVDTYTTNVMGTVNLLEAIRKYPGVRAMVNITTDKCYDNKEWNWGYRETEPMGGYDPYSNSKACSELVTSAYRSSFFNEKDYNKHRLAVATARAGNVIGGGDWAADRLVPDCIRALLEGREIYIRNPVAIRPWQHVLEPLGGYMLLAQKLYEEGPKYAEAWNFGPGDADARTVEWIVKKMCSMWGENALYSVDTGVHPHEAACLRLDCSKARNELGWMPKWSIGKTLEKIVEWTLAYKEDDDMKKICLRQILEYENTSFEV